MTQFMLMVLISLLWKMRKERKRKRPVTPDWTLPWEEITEPSVIDKGCWSVLGIAPTVDLGEIKRAYRRQIKKCHPDVAGAEGHAKTIMLNEAYKEAIKGAI